MSLHSSLRPHLRPTPSLVVSVLALVVAAGGTAYAGTHGNRVGTADLKPDSVTSGKIKDHTITANNLSTSLLSQTTGGRAWTYVTRGGDETHVQASLDPTYTHGFASLTHPATGVYCLSPSSGVDLSKSPILVSVEESASAGIDGRVEWVQTADECADGQIEVDTYRPQGGDEDTLSDDVAFTVFAP